ncbi:MAG: ABC transporter permease subunit [Chloroflexota bacterium]
MSGMITVFRKEMADHLTSWRFIILLTIVFTVGLVAIYLDAQFIVMAIADTRFVFLKLFTTSGQFLPLFTFFITFFMPIVGIVLGFDTINSEKSNGTLSRLISQPIYRDAVINGKFLAGITIMTVMLVSMVLLVAGVGLRMIGVPPSSEEIIRIISFLAASILYGAFWLGLSTLFSILFRRVTTSALASIALWMLCSFLFIVPFIASFGQAGIVVMQISPITIFQEIITILLEPSARTLGQIVQSGGVLPTSALSLDQSLLIVWPHLVSLVALTAICFAVSYIKFMREEIRST